ncbi:hypothetical protein BGX31_010450, partial [Mortierella sp. GBA43]
MLQLFERVKTTTLTSRTLESVFQPKQHQVVFAWCIHDQGLGTQDWIPPSSGSALAPEVELRLQDTGNQIIGVMRYATALFDSTTINRHVAYLSTVLEQVASNATLPATKMDIMPPSERSLVLQTWNATQTKFPSNLCLHHLFEQQAARTPESIAVVHEHQSLCYAELNSRANTLAHKLIKLGVQPDMPVAISAERSLGMIIGILAILKAGGAYVPLDPSYAGDRLREILDDTGSTILVADKTGQSAIGQAAMSSLVVVDPSTVHDGDPTNPRLTHLTSRHLAYVIYTSGSTGKPKGVMREHQGAVDVFCSRPELFAITTYSRFLQFASFGFNHSILEIFSPLTAGATLYLVSNNIRLDRYQLWDFLTTHAITHLSFTVSQMQACKDMPPLKSIQVLVVMSEASPPTLLEIMRTVAPNSTIINHYASSEVFSGVMWKCPRVFSIGTMPIGRPIPNKRVYVLDSNGHPVPLGAVGEIHIGGVGVARGYLNRSELTAEKFVLDPFSGDTDARMYKTGDLARYLPDGNLVYVGRNDYQVKIRGFRIEVGEIEARLKDHPFMTGAVVVALGEDTSKRLVAYVTCRDGLQEMQAGGPRLHLASILRSHLAKILPDYMLPAAYVRLDAFPLNPNGKLDRRALPAPNDEAFAREVYEEPQGEIEQALASIWSNLLKLEHVSRHDNFFVLGGHSLLAIQMISLLQHLGYSLSVRSLFDTPTLSVLAESIKEHQEIIIPPNIITTDTTRITPSHLPLIDLTQSEIDGVVERVPGGVSNVQDIYALSPLQDGILFHHLMAKSGDPYVVHIYMAFDSKELLDRYLDAIQQILNSHDILRTSFVWQGLSTPVQVVWRQALLSVTEFQPDPTTQGPVIQQLKQKLDHRSHRMDLNQAPLLRFITAQDGDGRWILVRLQHHLISDRLTSERMKFEIQEFLQGRGDALPPPVPYRNLIAQTRLATNHDIYQRFFKEMLSDVDTPTLPYGLTDTHGNGTVFTESHRMIPRDLNTRLRIQAKRLAVSLTSLCHLAWALVVAHTSGQQRVVFGTVLLGRMQDTTSSARAMGLFINTLPIRIDVDKHSVEDSVRATHKLVAALLEYEHASLALAQRSSGVPAGTPLFSSLLNYMHSSMSSESGPSRSGMELIDFLDRTNYPVCLSVEDSGDALALTAQTMQPVEPDRVSGYMEKALESLANALECSSYSSVAELEILPQEEYTMLTQTLNTTLERSSSQLCIHHHLEQQVERSPDVIAVVYGDQSLSYAELNARANTLAHQLIKRGVQPDSLVAICVQRTPEMIVGLLAILKAGGAYLPLDPAHASERLMDIVLDASPSIVLADSHGAATLQGIGLTSVQVIDLSAIPAGPITNPTIPNLSPDHMAYVIYTSGSTGKPKGVMVEHAQVTRLFTATDSLYEFTEHDTWTLLHSFAFDFSVWEIWGALFFGGKLALFSQDIVRSSQELYRAICEQNVTVLNVTPSAFRAIIEVHTRDGLKNSLRYVILGGEALAPAILRPWFTTHSQDRPQVVNMYGITETTVHVTHRRMTLDDCGTPVSPIGLRIPDLRTYVLDNRGKPCPFGAVGELYIGGAGVTRGYLNRPELTAERFIHDPFAGVTEARMYKTGDLARYLPDGQLVYLGRNDHQVKIRGFRIELGEVVANLTEHPLVNEAFVLAVGDDSNKRLVSYIVTKSDEETRNGKDATRMPEYMIPAAFVRMDALPLNSNGKVDRGALPNPDDDSFARQAFEEPQGEIEQAIGSLWADFLGVGRVSRYDSFFALGGHSLLAVRMMNRITTLGVSLPLAVLFNSPSLAAFAEEFKKRHEKGSSNVLPPIEPIPRIRDLPLSFEQQRLWFLAQLEDVSGAYHIPLAIRICGPLDRKALQGAFDGLMTRHEALRSVFLSVNGQPHVRILPAEGLPVRHIDLRGTSGLDQELSTLAATEAKTSFDLSQGPLVRATLFQVSENDHVLLVNQHHVVSDGWSMAIMARELSQLYKAHFRGESDPLPPLAIQYPDYSAWQRQYLTGDWLHEQAEYWRMTLAGVPVLIDLPTDHPRPPQQSFSGSRIPIALDADLTAGLKRLSHRHGVTLFMVMVAAWSAVLSRLSGQDDIVIGTPSANRGRREIEDLIGFFVNTLALRIDLSGSPTTRSLLERVRKCTLGAHGHQDLPFERVVEIVQPPRRTDHTPLFQVMFAWQNNESSMWDLQDLQVTNYSLGYDVAKFDLELGLHEVDGRIVGSLSYATSLFKQDTMERHIGYLETILRAMVVDSDQDITAVDLLSSTERTLLLHTWNETQEQYPDSMCVHHLFEQQVGRTPDSTAIVYEDQSLTYAELNARANSLAHHLIDLGVQPDNL